MNINSKEVNLRFGMLCIETFSSMVYGSVKKNPTGAYGISAIIYAAALNWYEVKEQPMPVTFEEVYDYVEENWHDQEKLKEFSAVSEQFIKSNSFKKHTGQVIEDEKKRKIGKAPDELPTKPD